MNTKSLFCSVTTLLLFTMACSVKEEDVVTEAVTSLELEFIAESAEGQTKTALQADEKSIWWSPADEISIFYGASEGCKFTSTNTEEVAKTVFRGTLDAFTGETEAGDFNYFWAVYPYSAAVSCDGNSVVAYLSDQQVGKAGSFAPNTNIAIAKSLGLSLGFYNACSWFRFSVKKEGVKRVIFRGNNNEVVAGQFSITMDGNGTPTAPTVLDGKKEIVLTMPENGTFTVGEMYYITLLPQVFQNGFTVTFETDGEIGSRSITAKATYLRSKYNSGVDFDKNVEYVGKQGAPLKFKSTGLTSISLTKTGGPDAITLEYKVDNGEWTSYTIGEAIDLTDGQELSFRAGASGNALFSKSYNKYYKFTVTGSGTVTASGNIMSLLNREGGLIIPNSYCFYRLFENCSKLTSAPEMPATTLAQGCYQYMFYDCTGLTTAPKLPATTLAVGCYNGMFHGCTSLISAAELSATTLAESCYDGMFRGCTCLTSAPELPATTLAVSCYNDMFYGCVSLTTAPALPATSLAQSCYYSMFRGCTGLTSAPELPATTLAASCYDDMFGGCTRLTSAPELPATTLTQMCYRSMFAGCTGLTSAPELPATTLAQECYDSMFQGCSGLISAPALPATSLRWYCYEYMFSGCTGLTSAPELPATTLTNYCYLAMFEGCTGLTSAPELPATALAKCCYSGMFRGCTGLTSAPELPATTLSEACYHMMFYGCTGLTSAPELLATALAEACYKKMFYGCTGLTSAPELLCTYTEDYCYQEMFYGCTNLNYIKMLATSLFEDDILNWVVGVAETGTFVKSSSATWDLTGNSGVPSGWTVLTAVPTPEAVDLGLPSGIKWASFNIGASAPEEYGDYYAWGEVEPYYNSQDPLTWKDGKTGYNWASYKWCNGFYDNKLTRYCPLDKTSYWDGVGSPDDMTKFSDNNYVDDVAWAILGGNWHIPTDEEWTELRTQCTWTWTTMNEVKGWSIAADNGNSIFLPRAGNWENTVKEMAYGKYWSSSLRSTYPVESMCVRFSSSSFDQISNNRCNGYSIRPVTE